MKKVAVALGLTSIALLSACGSSSDPSRKNLMAALEADFPESENFPHCIFRYNLPIEGNGQQLLMSGPKGKLDALVELGLVQHDVEGPNTQYTQRQTQHRYSLSSEGEKHYIPDRGICIGEAKLLDVVDISETFEEQGRTYVTGTYLWTVELPDWAKTPAFYDNDKLGPDRYYLKVEKLLEDGQFDDYFRMELTEDGWSW